MKKMEKNTDHASVTLNKAVMEVLPPEPPCDTVILDNGRTINNFIDNKIKELDSLFNVGVISTDLEKVLAVQMSMGIAHDNDLPFHVANLDSVFERHHRWLTHLPRVKPFYAVKCNNTPAVIQMLRALDTGFDCASKGEIQLALSLGVTPDKIIYAHTTKPGFHIKYACAHGVDLMTFDNEAELLKISQCHAKAKLILRIIVDDSKSLVRLSSKFGARLDTVEKLLERAKELGLEVIGVSFHVGSGCTDSLVFKQAISDARHVFDLANLLGFQMTLLDIGGGFSGREDFQVNIEEFSEVINGALDKFFPPESGVQIIAEPGRYYVESAFTLVVNIIAKRVDMDHSDGEENSSNRMVYYINDGVYGSLNCLINDPAHTSVTPYLHKAVDGSKQRYWSVIWGPTCDSLDKIIENYWIPELEVGDWLLIDNMGAYSVSITSTFNGFEKAHIYPVVTAETWHALNLSHTNGIIN
ncbi:ornithine decarboxylase-like [Scomber japonicus]|uniref:ornithine decarboxylase-like n=1 Tax=Scomber japonicus TaxID=13676 RepID=UPI002305C919|nr:ornithine decarboxylase-like [Scomber japonicus]